MERGPHTRRVPWISSALSDLRVALFDRDTWRLLKAGTELYEDEKLCQQMTTELSGLSERLLRDEDMSYSEHHRVRYLLSPNVRGLFRFSEYEDTFRREQISVREAILHEMEWAGLIARQSGCLEVRDRFDRLLMSLSLCLFSPSVKGQLTHIASSLTTDQYCANRLKEVLEPEPD